MTHDDAFLQDIVAHPDDDTPRLIYADWLDDHGNSDRAEFIRVQCELASLPEEDDRRWPLLARERGLLAAHEEEWSRFLAERLGVNLQPASWWARVRNFFRSPPAEPQLFRGTFERGFLQVLCLYCHGMDEFFPRADAYPIDQPLETLEVHTYDLSYVAELDSRARLTRLRRLKVSLAHKARDVVASVRGFAERFPELQHFSLDLAQANLSEALFTSHLLRRLRTLELADPDAECHRELAALLSRLDDLNLLNLSLTAGGMGPAGASYLAASPGLRHLRELDLVGNQLTDAGAGRLLCSPLAPGLRKLSLGRNDLGEATIRTLVETNALQALTHLDLSGNPLGDPGARGLASAQHLKDLVHLNLAGCEIGANGLAALARSSALAGLRTLLLSSFVGRHESRLNRLGDFGASHLARTPCLTKLTRLELRHTGIGADGVEALANSDAMRNLRVLDLSGNNIGERGVRALVQSRYLDKLQQLRVDLSSTRIGAWARRAFRERFRDALL